MTPTIATPAVRALAVMAALTLSLSACGLLGSDEPDPTETEEGATAEEAPDSEEGAPAKEGARGSGPLDAPGILTAACQPESGWLEFTLYSTEDAQELAHARFDTDGVVHAESDDLSHGRAADPRGVTLETSCDEGPPSLFPERRLVLGTFEEEVDGVALAGFGVMAEDGTFTALSPDPEEAGSEGPPAYQHPVADPERDRIVFVEETDEGEGSVQALDLASGEVTDLGTCGRHRPCENLTVLPGLDRAAIDDGQSAPTAVVFDGSTVVRGDPLGLSFFDIGDQADSALVDLTLNFVNRDRTTEVEVDATGTVHAVDATTLLFDDGALSVLAITEAALSDYEEENASTPRNLWESLPADRTLISEDGWENSSLALSPEGAELLFHATPPAGSAGWYTVPVDGSGAPEERADLPGDISTIISWR
ncbi:hypothetical protein [Nocardiopsis sp. NPDC006938]|uniref:hypothetical protein n=1 Tax=Nocardiopsis sp. NPDC006938 TaxID=3364337 RepID=UPI00367C9716